MSLGPLMLDIRATTLSPAERSLLCEPAVGGVILFARNYAAPEQLIELVASIRALRRPPLLLAVDHEGGRVQRFRDGFTAVPPMRQLGHEYDSDPERARQLARAAGWLIGSELRAVGIDLCFAPCVDLDWGVSEVIGDRAFHKHADIAATLALEFSRGLRSAGMAAVAKHFPGHGAVVADSHAALPVDRREFGELLEDMRPYERLNDNGLLAGVMTAHVVYPAVDELPASLSPVWIQQQLRGRTGFNGAVFSDDLSMNATRAYGSMPERARRALDAGSDMVLVCNDPAAAREVILSLADYSNPLALARLARLHGTGNVSREALLASDQWQESAAMLSRMMEPPELQLDA